MILRGASVLLAAVIAASCGGTVGRAAPAANATATTRVALVSPSATPLIDVNDMMGAFPPATFFVVGGDGIRAIALLNHATRYTISWSGKEAQVAAVGEAGRVYVLDQVSQGTRLRWFDLASGNERASRTIDGTAPVGTGIGHGTLVVDASTGLVYALLREPRGIAVAAFDWFTLRSARQVDGDFLYRGLRCGERLVAAAGRLAVACLTRSTGAIVNAESTVGGIIVDDGGPSFKLRAPFAITAMAMLGDGTLMAGGADGSLVRLARDQSTLEAVNALREYGKGLIPDGIAANGGCCFYFGILDPGANDVQVRIVAGGAALIAFPASTPPSGGVFVQAPFAYYVIEGKARHIDIDQGFQEVMADIGAGAMPGAAADR